MYTRSDAQLCPCPPYDCEHNYKIGSSKVMASSAALEIIDSLHGRGISVEFIVSDDDSKMRAHLHWQ